MGDFTHLDEQNMPQMVDVSAKDTTERTAKAQAIVEVGNEIFNLLSDDEIKTKKGPVFQTAIIAGIQAAKRTSELIPLCHPLALNKVSIDIYTNHDKQIVVECTAKVSGKTGVEMEALTGASVAALCIYDMCKALSHDILIKELKLMHKQGGKSNFIRK